MVNKTNEKADLTNGPIMRRLVYLAMPIVGSQILQMLYNLTDMFWLGRLGSDEVAASGAAGLYMWLSLAFMYIGSVGASIGVSRAVGSGDREKAGSRADAALFLSIVTGVAFAVTVFVFRRPMTGFFNFAERNVVELSERYLSVVLLTIPFTYLSATLGAVFTASGNSRAPFICNAAGVFVNIVLDPVLIFAFRLGISGAAYATAAAQVIAFITLAVFYKADKSRPFGTIRIFAAPKLKDVAWLIKKTLPICAESFLFTVLVIATTRREASFGADAMALSRVGSQIESLTWLVGGAFGSALISFVGQNYGAKKWGRIGSTFRTASAAMLCYGVFVGFLLAVPGKYIFGMFLPDPALMERSALYLRVLAICQIPMCLEAVSSNTFRGLGKTLPPAIVNTTCNIVRVPLAYLLSADFLGIGLPGVWIAVSASACLKGIWSFAWYFFAERERRKCESEGEEAEE